MQAPQGSIDKQGIEIVQLLSTLLGQNPTTVAKLVNDTADHALRYSRRNDGEPSVAPAPARFVDMGRVALIKNVMGSYYDAYAEALTSDAPPREALTEMAEKGRLPKEIARLLSYPDGNDAKHLTLSACGFGTGNLFESRFALRNGVILDIAPELHHLLEQTDVGNDLPWSQLRLPYPAVYIHLPPPNTPTTPQITGDATAPAGEYHDGFYAFEDVNAEGQRMITVMLVRNGSGGAATGSTTLMGALIEDEDQPIQQRVEELLRNYANDAGKPEEQVTTAKSVFSYLTKVMLYMSLPDRAATFNDERTVAMKKAQSAPAGLMRKKQQQKAERLYDHIVVGRGIQSEGDQHTGDGSTHRAVHWRRGHFRGQRVGVGRANIRTVWVRPALIGAAPGSAAPSRKSYDLKV